MRVLTYLEMSHGEFAEWHSIRKRNSECNCQLARKQKNDLGNCGHIIHMLLVFHTQGPLKGFLEDLGKLQKKFYARNERLNCPIRTYLVTARSAASSGARVLKTLRSWGLEIDEALFLAGAPKGPILVKIRPHIFFDDQMYHIEGAQKLGTTAAHVPYGIAQKYSKSK